MRRGSTAVPSFTPAAAYNCCLLMVLSPAGELHMHSPHVTRIDSEEDRLRKLRYVSRRRSGEHNGPGELAKGQALVVVLLSSEASDGHLVDKAWKIGARTSASLCFAGIASRLRLAAALRMSRAQASGDMAPCS